jgi:hypothetical protein
MIAPRPSTPLVAFAGSGAGAGALSALVFSAVHHLFISPIWFALGANLVAGAIGGACLAWSYALAVPDKTWRSWSLYNAAFVFVLIALAGTSMALFEPVTTIPALLQAKVPPRALIGRALPVTLVFTFASALLLCVRYRVTWVAAGAILVTTLVVVFFLGLNLSILGLVAVPRGLFYLVVEVVGLILALALVYAWTMSLFWRRILTDAGDSA